MGFVDPFDNPPGEPVDQEDHMAVTCPKCGSDLVETLADRFHCLNDSTYFTEQGELAGPGLVWTSERPASIFEDPPVVSDPVVLKNQARKQRKAEVA